MCEVVVKARAREGSRSYERQVNFLSRARVCAWSPLTLGRQVFARARSTGPGRDVVAECARARVRTNPLSPHQARFLDASTHLFMAPCQYVGLLVCLTLEIWELSKFVWWQSLFIITNSYKTRIRRTEIYSGRIYPEGEVITGFIIFPLIYECVFISKNVDAYIHEKTNLLLTNENWGKPVFDVTKRWKNW